MPDNSRRGNPRLQQKNLQLCAQIADVLSYVLPDSDDEVLQDLMVHSVEPAADSGEVLVLVQDPHGHGVDAVLQALDAAASELRIAIGDEIHRRRTPRLRFSVLPFVEGL